MKVAFALLFLLVGQLGKQTILPSDSNFYRDTFGAFNEIEEDAFLMLGNYLLFTAKDNAVSGRESTGTELYRISLRSHSQSAQNVPAYPARTDHSALAIIDARHRIRQSSTSSTGPEDFMQFVQQFSADKAFQLSRIQFPLVWKEETGNETIVHRNTRTD